MLAHSSFLLIGWQQRNKFPLKPALARPSVFGSMAQHDYRICAKFIDTACRKTIAPR
jgi:hypothetical protein